MCCQFCGKEVIEGAVFCPHCGLQIGHIVKRVAHSRKNRIAIAGFILAFIVPLLGWIFGGIGVVRSKYYEGKGRELSFAAITIASMRFVVGFAVRILIYEHWIK